jgi:hypothetical protein
MGDRLLNRRLYGSLVLAACAVAGAAFGLSGMGHLVEVPPMADASDAFSDEQLLIPNALSVTQTGSLVTVVLQDQAQAVRPPFAAATTLQSDPRPDAAGVFRFAPGQTPVIEYVTPEEILPQIPVRFEACLDLAGTELFAAQLGNRLRLPAKIRDLLALRLMTHYPEEFASARVAFLHVAPQAGWQADGLDITVLPLYLSIQPQKCRPQILSLLEHPAFADLAALQPQGHAVLVTAD